MTGEKKSHHRSGKYSSGKWAFGIPSYDIADLFVYFEDLSNTEKNSPRVAVRKENLYQAAKQALAEQAEISFSLDYLNSASEFLLKAAESERRKEVNLIRSRKDYLQNNLPDNKDIDKILQKLDDPHLLDDSNALLEVYTSLIQSITVLRSSLEEYEERIQTFKRHFNMDMKDLPADDVRFRGFGDVHALLNSATGRARKNQSADSWASKLRDMATRYAISSNVIEQCSNGADYLAVIAAISADMSNEMQKLGKENNIYDVSQLDDEMLSFFYEKYSSAEKKELTRVQKVIKDGGTELKKIQDAGKNIFGIRKISSTQEASRKKSLAQLTGKNSLPDQNAVYKKLVSEYGIDNKIIQDLPLYTFSSETSGSAGNFAEFVQAAFKGGIKVSGNAATDIIGYIDLFVDLDSNSETKISDYIQSMANSMTRYVQDQRKSRKESQEQAFRDMNEGIASQEKLLSDYLKSIDSLVDENGELKDDFFIYHDSLKLYKSIETDSNDKGFHGRELIILNYIDEMYSANGINDGFVLPNKDALELIALNLSQYSIGHKNKSKLAKYLSLFAGLIMFDDVQNMAKQALNEMTEEKGVKAIHLYKLNELYVPASMVLTYTYLAVKNATDTIARGNAAKATISTSQIDKDIKDFLDVQSGEVDNSEEKLFEERGYAAYWPEFGEKASSGTTVRVQFFAAFTQFIQNKLINTGRGL